MRRGGRFMGTIAFLVAGVYVVDILSPSAVGSHWLRQLP